jgi:hypothetical protein
MAYNCPLCGSPLTAKHYHRLIKIQKKAEKDQSSQMEALRKQVAAARNGERQAKLRQEQVVRAAEKHATEKERRKHAIREELQSRQIKKLKEANRMLREGTSPQEVGLADELVLVKRLQREFPSDVIEHTGKGGDVLHHVRLKTKEVGYIVYECKHTQRISTDHVQQTARAKRSRQADYAILVTTGVRKGFQGLAQEDGIFIVAQAGVITLARICRESLIMMAKQRLDDAAKEAAAKRLMVYIASPTFRTPVEEALSHTKRAQRNLKQEIKQHYKDWKERWEIYQTIDCDVSHVAQNVERVLSGNAPIALEKKIKREPLGLPMVSQSGDPGGRIRMPAPAPLK